MINVLHLISQSSLFPLFLIVGIRIGSVFGIRIQIYKVAEYRYVPVSNLDRPRIQAHQYRYYRFWGGLRKKIPVKNGKYNNKKCQNYRYTIWRNTLSNDRDLDKKKL